MVLTQQAEEIDLDMSDMFPYHYGSHATRIAVLFVRLCNRVSIPLWFLRNRRWYMRKVLENGFPYHYGSYATRLVRTNEQVSSVVSIPLWFLRNRFHYKIIIYDYGN